MSSTETEIQEWMRSEHRLFDLVQMAKPASDGTTKCYECHQKIMDTVAYEKTAIADGPIYLCIGCATAWYEGNAEVVKATAVARHILNAREYVGSSAWNWESEEFSNSLLDVIANACVTVNSGHWNSSHIKEAMEFLTFVEKCLRGLLDHQSMQFYIALLGAGMESASETGAVVTRSMQALVTMDRAQTIPRLLEQIETVNCSDIRPLPLRSWNSAFLLAKMSKIDGIIRTTPEILDLVCTVLTLQPDDGFPFAGEAGKALSDVPDDDVALALGRALSEQYGDRREYIALEIVDLASKGNETAIEALLDMCRTASVECDPALSIVLGTKFWREVPGCFERVLRVAVNDSDNFYRLIEEVKSNLLATLPTVLKLLRPDMQNDIIPELVEPGSELATILFVHQDPAVKEAFVRVLRSNQHEGSWAENTIDALRKNKEVSVRDAAFAAFGDDDDDQ